MTEVHKFCNSLQKVSSNGKTIKVATKKYKINNSKNA